MKEYCLLLWDYRYVGLGVARTSLVDIHEASTANFRQSATDAINYIKAPVEICHFHYAPASFHYPLDFDLDNPSAASDVVVSPFIKLEASTANVDLASFADGIVAITAVVHAPIFLKSCSEAH